MQFFRATREQIKALCLLIVLLTFVALGPALKWSITAAFRENPVRAGHMEVAIPRTWLTRVSDSSIEAWKPTMTVFSSTPSASMKISLLDSVAITEEIWLDSAQTVLRERRLSNPTPRSFRGSAGPIRCLEGTTDEIPQRAGSTCIASESRIVASFEGMVSQLNGFYSIVKSAQTLEYK